MSMAKARGIILHRISPEIFIAEQSASIWQNIGEFAPELNGAAYQEVFGILQRQALSSLVLSLGKLFEPPRKKYPNNSIPTAIEYLNNDIQAVRVNTASVHKLVDDLTDDEGRRLGLLKNTDEIPKLLLNKFYGDCPRHPPRRGSALDDAFEKIKAVRDKRVAHMEDIAVGAFSSADWGGVGKLLAFGESFVNLVGYGFFGFSRKGRVRADDIDLLNQSSGRQIRKMIETVISNEG